MTAEQFQQEFQDETGIWLGVGTVFRDTFIQFADVTTLVRMLNSKSIKHKINVKSCKWGYKVKVTIL